ncbi:MAG: tyrosine-type recombinase/integrase [Acetobacteraceae bacterium]
MTFAAVAERYLAAHEGSWRNPKHRQQWHNTLRAYVLPEIGKTPVAAVAVGDVMRILEPIWREKPETASRVRGRIESILDYAIGREWRADDNPARWRGRLQSLLPARNRARDVQHHAALPWREIGAFMVALRKQNGMGAMAAEFAILTAARLGEARGARWNEIDLEQRVWVVRAERMKAGREHRVPLSDRALGILVTVRPLSSGADALVFPGQSMRRPLSDVALAKAVAQAAAAIGAEHVTAHGMRSTLRTWASESTAFPSEVAEAALAHANRNKVEASYLRSTHVDRRRQLTAAWALYIEQPPAGADVVPIRA